jgi:hypothetical protein
LLSSSYASQNIPHILWNPKVHFCYHKSSPFIPILIHANPFCAIPSYFRQHFNIVLPSILFRCSKWSFSFMSLHQNSARISLLLRRSCHISPPLSSLIWSPVWYSVTSTGHEGRFQWPRGLRRRSASVRLLGRGFEYSREHGCLSVVSVVCYQVEVSATVRSLLRGNPTECDLDTSKWESLGPLGAIEPRKKCSFSLRSFPPVSSYFLRLTVKWPACLMKTGFSIFAAKGPRV